ncbi:efflux RND transporter periplasmic adaptor subunit [Methylobacillus flagellatus]|uniref:Secretion protein HlyD n=1 Tax=Methylobacillus flagellatus (strain ATCC 51484 / DSM 6875 / VKM B-1610 / KT) TaxID=265072 RepID=Q1H1R4_METFK|nr:efflux RND transporter periplasmic adaptor subunit [Methylobacillus flagellatus]ABE49573.1 Secretion protein HlyD [Methylobacillus flagellatus KT]
MKRFLLPLVFLSGVGLGGWLMPWTSTPLPEPEAVSQPAHHEDAMSADKVAADFFVSALPEQREIEDVVPLMGRLAFNAEKTHLVSARIAGRLDRIFAFEGAQVRQGQPLAALYSPEYISAQNELLLAHNTWRTLQASKATQELAQDAESTLQSARERMRVMGASEQDIAALEQSRRIHEHLLLRAPISGVVTQRNLDPGAFINLGDSFMSLADTSTLWFFGHVYEQDYQRIRQGQPLQLEVQALPDKRYSAHVDILSPTLDVETNTLRIRCLVVNDGTLRPDLFATAGLSVGKRQALLVPMDAVVRSQQMDFLIVETPDGHYRRRQVNVKPYSEGVAAVMEGLSANEKIVVRGATLLNQKLSGAI